MFLKVKDSANIYHTAQLRMDFITGFSKVKEDPNKIRVYLLDGKEFIVDAKYLDDFGRAMNLKLDLK